MKKTSSGFTIVELLVVIVVVAILAAVSIVAYIGIQNQAQTSAAKGALSQALTKLATYQVSNGQFPPDQTTLVAQLGGSNGIDYQYTVNNGTTPQTYCVTATAGTVSYYLSSATGSSAQGGCAGHGQGGVSAITNLAANPSVESNLTSWAANWGTSGTGTAVRMTDGGHDGNAYFRTTWSAAPTVTWGGHTYNFTTPGTVGAAYSAGVWVRSSTTHTLYVCIRTNDWSTGGAQACGASASVSPSIWTRLTVTLPAYSASSTSFYAYVGRSGAGSWQPGDALDTDSLIIVQSTNAPNFADGNSSNWVWSGTVNNSTSTGPPV